jgi:RimJ/RimL family protein N-acetyltransferase
MDDTERLGELGTSALIGRRVRLEPLEDRHRDGLRAACAADPEIWQIYPYSMLGDEFDRWWHEVAGTRRVYAVVCEHRVVGMSSFYAIDRGNRTLAIGSTYFVPEVRGRGINDEAKLLMLQAAFGHGARRVEFHVDAINARSRAAVEKLGAKLDGVMRKDRVTWTGRVRDTCVYSLLAEEWPGVAARLEARTAA